MQLGQRQVAVVYLSVSLCVRKWHRLTLTAARGSTSKKTDREGGLRVKGKARGTDDPPSALVSGKNLWGRGCWGRAAGM